MVGLPGDRLLLEPTRWDVRRINDAREEPAVGTTATDAQDAPGTSLPPRKTFAETFAAYTPGIWALRPPRTRRQRARYVIRAEQSVSDCLNNQTARSRRTLDPRSVKVQFNVGGQNATRRKKVKTRFEPNITNLSQNGYGCLQ